ncbi:MAG: hypothetical protein WC453_03375 [Patescibacteria group bacterium]
MISEIPEQPYFLSSGRYEGQAVETLIFQDPAAAISLLRSPDCALVSHLNFLFSAGENLPTIPYCFCGRHKVVQFTIKNGKARYDMMCCADFHCSTKLINRTHAANNHDEQGIIYPISLRTLCLLSNRPPEQQQAAKFMKNIIGLSRHANPKQILALFADHYQNSISIKK